MAEPVNIKGTRNGLVILFDSNADYDEIKNYLHKKMQSAKGFFKGAKFTLQNHNDIPENYRSEIEEICTQYGLIRSEEKIELPNFANNTTDKKNDFSSVKRNKTPEPPGEQTLLIKRTLRSGHSIKYNGHVVVMGDVHAGAEIIAGGNVMVLGRLSGVVHAGATGDVTAKVVANKLCPTQLRIGPAIVTSPDEEPQYPEIAKLHNGQIMVEKFVPSKM
ncbi:septum site-determining protein MinC [Desulfohalotomaculum tongense]|uniref:septum site-determining protein MinC n=1 Tax=Desulforadius tongensis TaxID=1216062 RepID=UPI00195667AF|nr:septum site-determining protein MinC [Desulforadius tongensis]MBM7854157.1 septum site-determining protein MinC [Desulforadius tongensis]